MSPQMIDTWTGKSGGPRGREHGANMKCVHCKDTGTVQADGHEVLCTCVRELAADPAATNRLARLVDLADAERSAQRQRDYDDQRTRQRVEAWAWLDKIELSQFKPVRSPCKRWWAQPARYAGMDYHMEIWLRDPETCGGDMVEWVGTLELSGEGWLLCDARTLLVALQLDGAPAPVDLPIEPAPTPAEAMARGIAAVEAVMVKKPTDPYLRLSIDGVRWASAPFSTWAVGNLAFAQRDLDGWQWWMGGGGQQSERAEKAANRASDLQFIAGTDAPSLSYFEYKLSEAEIARKRSPKDPAIRAKVASLRKTIQTLKEMGRT
jgi:hypothetical protein